MAANGGIMFGQVPMLTKRNHSIWAIKMKALMRGAKIWDAVEPEDAKTVAETMDQKALTAIYQGVPEDLIPLIAEKKTSAEAWETIKTNRLGDDHIKEVRVQALKSEFDRLQMKDTESVDDFALRMKTITNEIRLLGEKFEESNAVRKFLQAVPSKFLEIVSAIEQFGDLKTMTMEEVTGRLKAHEERLRGSADEKGDEQLLLTRSQWLEKERGRPRDRSIVRCYNCHIYGHYARECPKPRKEKAVVNLNMACTEDEPALF
ncbi:hypothetical protein ACQ4PT_057927 [Festuca glaucescens]